MLLPIYFIPQRPNGHGRKGIRSSLIIQKKEPTKKRKVSLAANIKGAQILRSFRNSSHAIRSVKMTSLHMYTATNSTSPCVTPFGWHEVFPRSSLAAIVQQPIELNGNPRAPGGGFRCLSTHLDGFCSVLSMIFYVFDAHSCCL